MAKVIRTSDLDAAWQNINALASPILPPGIKTMQELADQWGIPRATAASRARGLIAQGLLVQVTINPFGLRKQYGYLPAKVGAKKGGGK